MRNFLLVLTAAASLAMTAAASGQAYLNGAPFGGPGTYSPPPGGNMDDPRFRNDNWRDPSADNWRSNNWREDRNGDHGTWRRNTWREDRTDEARPYTLRDGQVKKDDADAKNKSLQDREDNVLKDDCRTTRNRPGIYSKEDCR